MLDMLEVAVKFLQTRPGLAGLSGRIAARHRYGAGWATSQAALTAALDGGQPEWYAPIGTARLEVTIYAPTVAAALEVQRALEQIGRETNRVWVTLSSGGALVQAFLPESAPSVLHDDALGMETVVSFWRLEATGSQ